MSLKPFRDLASGLASQGIAVLRYNKRTYEHAAKMSGESKINVDNETTDDAVLAVKAMAKQKRHRQPQYFYTRTQSRRHDDAQDFKSHAG